MKTALVTNADDLLGAALVGLLGNSGYMVYAGTAEGSNLRSSAHVSPVEMNMADDVVLRRATTKIYREHGRLDMLIGVGATDAFGATSLAAMEREPFNRAWDEQVTGALVLAKNAERIMTGADCFVVFPVATRVGDYAYSAREAATSAITKCLAGELGANVSVCAVTYDNEFGRSDAESTAQQLLDITAMFKPEQNGQLLSLDGSIVGR